MSGSGIYTNPNVGKCIFAFGLFMFAAFIACALFILYASDQYRKESLILGALWVVGVPAYFFLEHVVLFRRYGEPSQYGQFKRVQDLAAKVWAGAVLVLAAFFAETFPESDWGSAKSRVNLSRQSIRYETAVDPQFGESSRSTSSRSLERMRDPS